MIPQPRLVFWEITGKCNLSCHYCRRETPDNPELPVEKAKYVIDSIAVCFHPLIVFTGGEPLLHTRLFEIVSCAVDKGFQTALATNGTLVTEDLARKIRSAGFRRVAVSLDGSNSNINDSLRGEGTFSKIISGIRHLREENVDVQVNATIFRKNAGDIPSLISLCSALGVKALHLFVFVPAGCGINIPGNEILKSGGYEELLEKMADIEVEKKIEIRLTCAPGYSRVLRRRQPEYAGKRKETRGCLAGSGVFFLSAEGEVRPCGYLPLSAGNIFREPLRRIWEESPLFHCLRNTAYLKGKCGVCEYKNLCGGCRARAYKSTGDYLEEEKECVYQPLREIF